MMGEFGRRLEAETIGNEARIVGLYSLRLFFGVVLGVEGWEAKEDEEWRVIVEILRRGVMDEDQKVRKRTIDVVVEIYESKAVGKMSGKLEKDFLGALPVNKQKLVKVYMEKGGKRQALKERNSNS
eukprot:TRINITY_DN4437_c0_g1_i1.p1 TRINITY_DN4437_c0_g1~~TRINITY_DN4437_c0_g1_i1.p1  ORF type:complete len:142 (+),score=51.69 TRINITY_DN4437_c0_g1_i1:50-427(+)